MFATVSDWPPAFKSATNAHGSELDRAAANLGVRVHILIHDSQRDVVVYLHHFQVKSFVPARRLAAIFDSLRACLVLPVSDDHVGVHTKVIGSAHISIQNGLDHGQAEAALSRHIKIIFVVKTILY